MDLDYLMFQLFYWHELQESPSRNVHFMDGVSGCSVARPGPL